MLASFILFSVSCGEDTESDASNIQEAGGDTLNENIGEEEIEQEVFTFIPQEIQPLEENPFLLPMNMSSERGLHRLSVEKPQMDENTNPDDVINALLGAPNQVADIKSTDFMDFIYVETGDQPINKLLSEEDGYIRVSIQNQDNTNQETGEDLWADLYLDAAINYYAIETGGMDDCSNCAVLIKYRNSGVTGEENIGFSNSNIGTTLNIDNMGKIYFWSCDEQNQSEYFVEHTSKEYSNQFEPKENEWHYALIAMDEHSGYRFLIWQQNDPQNNAFYACDLSDVFKIDDSIQGQKIWTNINFRTPSDEASFDIETIKVYEFENFEDIEVNTENEAEIANYDYTNDYEKYRLAVDLFNDGDYYNAYLLLKELNGYDTSETYFEECKRLLQTVQIDNQYVAAAVKKAMKDIGMTTYDCLYVYQAEKLERLDLSDCKIEDLSFLSTFINLKELSLDNNGLSDLMPLKDLYSLERLSLAENNITDLLPLYNLTNLEFLDLSSNIICDVQPLGNLKLLKELDLFYNNIYTLSGLYALENLEKVDLSYNFISSVNALGGSDIKELNVLNTNISSLSAVAGFSNLESLTAGFKLAHIIIAGCPIEWQAPYSKYKQGDGSVWEENLYGIEYIQGFENLRYLELARLELGEDEEELLPLTTLPSLEVLKFYKYNGPSGVETLGKLTNLKELALDTWERGFYDLSFLPKLINLKKFEGPAVPTLSLISQLENLEELRIGGNIEESLDYIGELKNLKLLTISGGSSVDVLDFSFLEELGNLEDLSIVLPWTGFTQKNVEKAFELEGLEYLNIIMWEQQLESIERIKNLQNLKYLKLIFNTCDDSQIVDESQFSSFEALLSAHVRILQGANNCEYFYDFSEDEDESEKSGNGDADFSEPQTFDIKNSKEEYFLQKNYGNKQNMVIEFWIDDPDFYDEVFTLKIPKGVRNLYIFNPFQERIRLNIDATECVGLEWLVIGEVPMEGGSEHPDYGNRFTVENLDGLSDCVNLRYIFMEDAEISDISGLADCDQLEILQLNANKIKDISALEGKEQLRELYLNYNNIEDISELENCIRLQTADLSGNPVKSRDALYNLPLLIK